jgi:hypothetical protein
MINEQAEGPGPGQLELTALTWERPPFCLPCLGNHVSGEVNDRSPHRKHSQDQGGCQRGNERGASKNARLENHLKLLMPAVL